jgi:Tol biopolymer transport system component
MATLIPLSKLFGNPDKADPKLSPDGKRFAYLANSSKGVLNVFVQNIGDAEAKQISNDEHRGIRVYQWAKNNTHILYKQVSFRSFLHENYSESCDYHIDSV